MSDYICIPKNRTYGTQCFLDAKDQANCRLPEKETKTYGPPCFLDEQGQKNCTLPEKETKSACPPFVLYTPLKDHPFCIPPGHEHYGYIKAKVDQECFLDLKNMPPSEADDTKRIFEAASLMGSPMELSDTEIAYYVSNKPADGADVEQLKAKFSQEISRFKAYAMSFLRR